MLMRGVFLLRFNGVIWTIHLKSETSDLFNKNAEHFVFRGFRPLSPFKFSIIQTPGKYGTIQPMFIRVFFQNLHKHCNCNVSEGRLSP